MDNEALKTESDHCRTLIKEHKRRLHVLELQQAKHGSRVDPGVETEIEDIKRDIAAINHKLEIISEIEICFYKMDKRLDQIDSAIGESIEAIKLDEDLLQRLAGIHKSGVTSKNIKQLKFLLRRYMKLLKQYEEL
jgi:hypothetical protein